ncbi:IS21 family transposase [Desulfotomaculum sp. 1211_IL3151]|uniref:IS21 family transposase n=1 Tax=Desulfotomaculum sp. 1211_IL3151 TaxID=3084055 RepID=UPI002FDB5EE0
MINYREILRLRSLDYSQRQIAASVRSSRDTVSQVFRLATIHGLSWPLPDEMSNQMIYEMFFPAQLDSNAKRIPDYAQMHKELAKPGVTLTLLWSEYCEKCYSEDATHYQYTQFCDNYRRWARATKATMRIKRKPGDAFEVDWAGNTMSIYDKVTGEQSEAYIFVGVLPCSCYAYVEAFPSMVTENWITAHVHAYNYFGGVTRIVIPDNLKTGVIKNTRFETVLNRSYNEMAAHYDTAIIPTRVERPKDYLQNHIIFKISRTA